MFKRKESENMFKLISIDLDGTLLNSDKKISNKNKTVLKKAMDKGIKVVVSTGRIVAGGRIFANEIGTKDPLIACNGAIIKDLRTEGIIYGNYLGNPEFHKVINICRSSGIYFHAYIGDTMYTEKLDFSSLFYWNKNQDTPEKDRVDIKLVENLNEALEESRQQASKIVIISRDLEHVASVRRSIENIGNIGITSSYIDNFEVMNQGVDKGTALKFLAEKLGIKREEIMALGDNENDASMLEYAGIGIAMNNGLDYIKEMADHITLTNDEDGVAHAINKFVFGEQE